MRYQVYKASEWLDPLEVPFIYTHALNKPLSRVNHCHDFYEIIFLFSGQATHTINGVRYQMNEGDVAFLRPLDQHVFTNQTEMLELFSISVVEDEMKRLLEAYHIDKEVASAKPNVTFTLNRNVQRTLLYTFKKLSTSSTGQQASSIRIILGTVIHEFLTLQANKSNEWIDNILLLMRQPKNLAEGIPALLRISNLSHAQLCRVIKKRTGYTPQQYIKNLRLNYAYDLIQSTNMHFEEIALTVGYSSFSHFSTSFKERFGISASNLRKTSNYLL